MYFILVSEDDTQIKWTTEILHQEAAPRPLVNHSHFFLAACGISRTYKITYLWLVSNPEKFYSGGTYSKQVHDGMPRLSEDRLPEPNTNQWAGIH